MDRAFGFWVWDSRLCRFQAVGFRSGSLGSNSNPKPKTLIFGEEVQIELGGKTVFASGPAVSGKPWTVNLKSFPEPQITPKP